MKAPIDIIVLGAPRCATTSIAGYLSQHPDVVLSEPKEPHFFDAAYEKGLTAVPALYFSHRKGERLAAEATPDYLALPWVPERIARDVPRVRLIATLRNPVDRAWSQWWLLHSRGIEELGFVDAMSANLEQVKSGVPIEESRWKRHVSQRSRGIGYEYRMYLDHGYYARNLERYFEVIDRNRCKIVFTHELGAHTEDVVRELYRFLGVPDSSEIDITRTNEALGSGSRTLMRSARSVGLTRLGPLLPDATKQRVKDKLATMGERPPIPEDMRARLTAHFEPHNRALERLLDLQLPW